MKTVPVGEFPKQFSSVLETVKKGEPVGITSGANGQTVAVLMPPDQLQPNPPLRIDMDWLDSLPVNPPEQSADVAIREDRDARD
jgi:antitoxin (DNA-binding transcriptional repressor) of toxin-antitoxin stability system